MLCGMMVLDRLLEYENANLDVQILVNVISWRSLAAQTLSFAF